MARRIPTGLVALAVVAAAPAARGQSKAAGAKPPPATEASASANSDADAPPDLDALRKQYLRLRDKLFRSRARAAAVGDALYSTKLSLRLHFASGRFYAVDRATIRLDGANVFDDTQGTIAADRAPRFEGFVAPGRHVVSVRIEVTGKDDDRFQSTVDGSFTLLAPAGKLVVVDITAKDDGDIPYAWKKKQRGSYRLRLDADVHTETREGADGKGIRRAQLHRK